MERIVSYSQAIWEATDQEMARDASVMVLGIGVDDPIGIYGTTKGLAGRFGAQRVFDTPIAEDGMTGVAIGCALGNMRPIQVHERMDFSLLAMNQLVNMAAKMRYMSGGLLSVPLVVRAIIGRSWGQGPQHSQGLHSMFMHVPGVKVVAPTTPYDAKGCLAASIRDDNPVIFVEHRMLHFVNGHVPEEPYVLPLGRARVLEEGDDCTVVGVSHMVLECLRARSYLGEVGISAEVIDPVCLAPLDIGTIVESVRKTGRLLVVDNAWTNCGASAEIIARVVEHLQGKSKLRVGRLGFQPVTCPTTRFLEDNFYPNARTIASSAYSVVHPDVDSWIPDGADAPEVIEFRGPF